MTLPMSGEDLGIRLTRFDDQPPDRKARLMFLEAKSLVNRWISVPVTSRSPFELDSDAALVEPSGVVLKDHVSKRFGRVASRSTASL